jgi:hypothetical protein
VKHIQFKTNDEQSVTEIFAASWANVNSKETWKTGVLSRGRLQNALKVLMEKFELINVPFFCILGGEKDRGFGHRPEFISNSLAMHFGSELIKIQEDYYFHGQTRAQLNQPIAAHRVCIPTDTDCNILRRNVSAALLSMCSKMYILTIFSASSWMFKGSIFQVS